MFGSGTAAIVTPIKSINHMGAVFPVPIEEEAGAGPMTQKILKTLSNI